MRILTILALIMTLLAIPGCSSGQMITSHSGTSQTPPVEREQTIAGGTSLDELDLSGLKAQDAQAKIKAWEEDKLAQTVHLVYNKTEIPVTLKDLGVALDFEKVWDLLWKQPGRRVESFLKIDSVQAHRSLQEKLAPFTRSAVDASYTIDKDQVVIKPAVPGRVIQAEAFIERLQNETLTTVPKQIEVTMAEIPAAVTTESVKELAFDGVIGEFTTPFNVSDENRSANLATAAKKLDKTVLKPGETFSFNQTIGPRTAETGYKDAYVIINNEYVQDIGGGVCQVSSTLYSAAVLANLEIVERHPHALAIGYIPLGQDATVNYPNLDLKFKNNTSSFIYIRTDVKPGKLTVRLYGKKTGKTVRFVHEIEKVTDYQTIKRLDPNLPPGKIVQDQNGNKGYVVKTWRVVKDASGAESEQFLSRDVYSPTHRILRVGAD